MDWRKLLLMAHRWLGIAGGVLVVLWFATGIVMMYARMPAVEAEERLSRLPPLDLQRLEVSPAEAARALGSDSGLTISMFGARPVYRIRGRVVFADSGEPIGRLRGTQAMRVASTFMPEHARTFEYVDFLSEPDQWTLQSRPLLPMHVIAAGDDADTRLYVSDVTSEVVMMSTRSERLWAYAGAVLHWLYFTPFRVHTTLWAQTIIWLSVLGCLLTLSGLAWGVLRFAWRRPGGGSGSPYSGLLRWHHYAGLVFGFFTFTWMLSGGLSMDPWSWHPGTAPTPAQHAAVTGGAPRLDEVTVDAVKAAAAALAARGPVKELHFVHFRGAPYLTAAGGAERGGPLVVHAAEPERGAFARFGEQELLEVARAAMPGVPIADEAWLEAYDSYYYGRGGTSPALPVLRVRYADPQRTWLYFDPARGAVVRKEERLTRLNRWLYHGFHSLDFPFLYGSRPLWDLVVIVLSLGGLLLAGTTLWPGWQRIVRHVRRVGPRRGRTA